MFRTDGITARNFLPVLNMTTTVGSQDVNGPDDAGWRLLDVWSAQAFFSRPGSAKVSSHDHNQYPKPVDVACRTLPEDSMDRIRPKEHQTKINSHWSMPVAAAVPAFMSEWRHTWSESSRG
jgi:hypothetical protein